ncbi:MAG: tetratricopeptide repeat protein [Planctomycetes bacterium]|nr:tetratricopeptide repeat protein [Planctomycetota bacterium]
MDFSAENAYLFRHAVVRDAAYQLILPTARAELHGAAIHAMEARGQDFANQFAAELAQHARLAGDSDAEVRYLTVAAQAARSAYQNATALELLRRLCELLPYGSEPHVDALVSLAEAYDFNGDTEPAIDACRRVIDLAARAAPTAQGLRAATLLPQILRASARYDEALDVIAEHQSSLERHGDTPVQTRQLMNLAAVFQHQGQTDKAVDAARRAMELAETGSAPELFASALANYSFQLIYASRPKEAEPLLLRAVETLKVTGRRELIVQAQLGLATLYVHMGVRDKADTRLRETLREARAIGHHRTEATTLANLGVSLYEQGRDDEALDYYQAALELHRENGSRAEAAGVLANMTSLYNSSGRFVEAADTASRGLAIAREVGNIPNALTLQMYLSRALLFQGRLAAAEACLRQGIRAAQAGGLELEHAAMLAYLANVLLLTGREAEGEQCLRTAEESRPFAQDHWRGVRISFPVRCHFLMANGQAAEVRASIAREEEIAAEKGGLHDYFIDVIAEVGVLEMAVQTSDDSVMWQGYVIEKMQPGLRRALAEHAMHTEEGQAVAAKHPAAAATLKRLSANTAPPDWTSPDWQALHTGDSFGMQRG